MNVEWRPAGAFEQRVTVLTFSLVQAMLLESRSRYAFSQSLYVFNRAPLSEPVFGRQSTLLRVERTHYKDENSLLPRSWGVHIVPVDTTRLQVHIRLNARIKPFAAVLRPQFIGAFSLLFHSTVLRYSQHFAHFESCFGESVGHRLFIAADDDPAVDIYQRATDETGFLHHQTNKVVIRKFVLIELHLFHRGTSPGEYF